MTNAQCIHIPDGSVVISGELFDHFSEFARLQKGYDEHIALLRGNLSLAEEGLANATQEIHQLRTALGTLTNGYKYPAEVCEIARKGLANAHEQNATPGAAISSEDSVSYSAESSGPRGLQLQQANLEAGIAKLGEIHNSQEGVIVHGPEATALLAALTFEPLERRTHGVSKLALPPSDPPDPTTTGA